MKVSIVIRSYNEAQHIGKLLLGISAQTVAAHEVIVVDSGSTDDTVSIARRHGAKIIEIDKREFTFGRALNIGCRAATGDILVFVSSHVYPTRRSWLFELIKPFDDERVVLTYGKQRGDDVNKFSEHQIFKAWFPERSICPQLSYFCNNANCAVRRSVWLEQPYDETLTGLEDLAWAKSAQEKGGWIAYASRAEIIHVHDETWRGVRNRYRREAMALRRIDKSGRFSAFDFIRTLLTNCVVDLVQAMREGKLIKEAGSILAFRYNQFVGTYQGHNGPSEVTAELRRIFYFPQSARASEQEELCPVQHELINYERLQSGAPSAPSVHARRLAVVGSEPRSARTS
ncbi:glycosyltransferase [Hyphomicrobium sp.]|uniref:glycosyltransferase family 2 protein n=1 Tax=Hyphomicrobium sp. TaxID=82 RepID=UPI002B942E7C|nr:glycosyltransferase [Hyphomicrobium sp.]HVU21442.1 glycosyltransferase [Rhizomicrobium sp.]HVX35932.1 glycosyltransferase [Hyphomicrobium sp.]HVZ03550.1 glycosyltransferase [Hyphomicrobium sp.]